MFILSKNIDTVLNCFLVGMRGFEPPTPCTPYKCATKLRYIPNIDINTEKKICRLFEYFPTQMGLCIRILTSYYIIYKNKKYHTSFLTFTISNIADMKYFHFLITRYYILHFYNIVNVRDYERNQKSIPFITGY